MKGVEVLSFSKREEYAINLISSLSQNFDKKQVSLSIISKSSKIPLPFLRQIAQDLKKAGLITSTEGKNGGYALAKEPKTISLADVIEAVDKRKLITCCDPENPDSCACSQEKELLWKKLNKHYIKNYYRITFDRLC